VERGNMPMPDGFLAPRVRGDALDRQVHFDETFGIIKFTHDLNFPRGQPAAWFRPKARRVQLPHLTLLWWF